MKFIDNIKADWQKVKDKPRKEKWEFFWDYYKIPAICIVLVIVLVVQGIFSSTNQKQVVFSGFALNCKINMEEDPFWNGFYEVAGIDKEIQTVGCSSDMQIVEGQNQMNSDTIQKIIASCAVQEADFVIGDPYAFRTCAYTSQEIFTDLRDILDAETLAKHADRLYYIDKAIIDVLNSPVGEQVEPNALEYPQDPKKPETMKNPIPVGIDVSNREDLRNAYYLGDTAIFVGAIKSSARPELTKQFLEYLLK